jgi:hypothetical protein
MTILYQGSFYMSRGYSSGRYRVLLVVTRLRPGETGPKRNYRIMPLSHRLRSAWTYNALSKIGAAQERPWRSLGLVDRNDPLAQRIASKIIEIARSGKAPAAAICDQTLKELDAKPM